MRFQNPFAALAPVGTDSQVLTVLAEASAGLTVRQIHGLLPEEGSAAAVRNSLSRLTTQGTVDETTIGNVTAYSLNDDHLLIDAIRSIKNSRRTLVDRLRHLIQNEWPFEPILVVLFGSAARNDMNDDSDIDLLVVLPDTVSDVDAERTLGDLSVKVTSWTGNPAEVLPYRQREIAPSPIFKSILDEGIRVFGDIAWLRQATTRMPASA